MASLVPIMSKHPLSRLYAYPKLPLGDVSVTSIEMGYYYILLRQHGEDALAAELLQREELKWDPPLISPWVERKGVIVNTDFLIRSRKIYTAILVHQIDKLSQFGKCFFETINAAPDPYNITFGVCSATHEMIYSCGLKFRELGPGKEYPGFHVYGEILISLAQDVVRGERLDTCYIEQLMCNFSLYRPFLSSKSVLIISDSQGKFIRSVYNGTITSISGGRYKHVTEALRRVGRKIEEYKWVIISAGTNMAIRNPGSLQEWQQRDSEWRELKETLVQEAQSRAEGSILFSCAFSHPRVPGIAGHSRVTKEQLEPEGIACLNWDDIGNPFVVSGRIQERFFEKVDLFHLNHLGVRALWTSWCHFIPGLKYINYQLSPTNCAMKKQYFETNGHGNFKKRRFNYIESKWSS